MLRRIDIDGFTSISSASVELGRLNVLIGANGAGKSNFIRALELLGRLVDNNLGYFIGKNGGAAALLNAAVGASQVRLTLDAGAAVYQAVLEPAAGDHFSFTQEEVSFNTDSTQNLWEKTSLGEGHRETGLHRALGNDSTNQAVQNIIDLLKGCRVFHFHDASINAPPKRTISTADNLMLRQDAANLAAVLLKLREDSFPGYATAYNRIVSAVQHAAPFFQDFVLQPEHTDLIILRWKQKGTDAIFSANQLSDGTLRFICLATLLLHPKLPGLVILDEPELGLHPAALTILADLLRSSSARSQIVIATQSVTLMNQFAVNDIITVERYQGSTIFNRPDPEKLKVWLEDYSLGEIWEMNLIGGRPRNEGTGRD